MGTDVEVLQELVDAGRVGRVLRQGSTSVAEVRALQRLLHDLGFDRELQWSRHADDGDYGRGTTAAVAAFAERNGLVGDGSVVSAGIGEALLARLALLPHARRLDGDVAGGRAASIYYRRSTQREAVRSLQYLLNALGFGAQLKWSRYGADGDFGGGTVNALAAFAAQEGFEAPGDAVTDEIGERVVDRVGAWFGDDWRAREATAPVRVSQLLVRETVGRGKRRVLVSDGVREKTFVPFKLGLYTAGDRPPWRFLQEHAAALRARGVSDSALAMLIATAENEGNLDAVNTWDNAFLSFGMFQWTAGPGRGKGELAALLDRVRTASPPAFRECFAQHGLGVTECDGTYGWVTLDGAPLKTEAAKTRLRTPEWAYRFWLAGQHPDVQAAEVLQALARLDLFYDTDAYRVAGRYRVAELVRSEYGVALLLDNHVNRPAYVNRCLAEALTATGLGPPSAWGTPEELRLIDAYLRVRQRYGSSPMTDAAKRAAVTRRHLEAGRLSDERGSFTLAAPPAPRRRGRGIRQPAAPPRAARGGAATGRAVTAGTAAARARKRVARRASPTGAVTGARQKVAAKGGATGGRTPAKRARAARKWPSKTPKPTSAPAKRPRGRPIPR
jgi:peptidoglycan hydrolase-like protein with peptidoglycan-binding domain